MQYQLRDMPRICFLRFRVLLTHTMFYRYARCYTWSSNSREKNHEATYVRKLPYRDAK
jgi:hypothetical protein